MNLANPQSYSVPGAAPNGADYVLLQKNGTAIKGKDLRSLKFNGAAQLPALPLAWTLVNNDPDRPGNSVLFSGNANNTDATAVIPVTVPATNATLSFQAKYGAELGTADLAIETLGEPFEVDVGRIHVLVELSARRRTHVACSDSNTAHTTLTARLSDINRVFHEHDGIVVRVRHALTSESLRRRRELLRACPIGECVHLARLAHVPVLTKLASKVATGGTERQHRRARQEMIQRFLLDRVDTESAGAAVGV